jgi:hypothetical protein
MIVFTYIVNKVVVNLSSRSFNNNPINYLTRLKFEPG